jgi:hypothetical protein
MVVPTGLFQANIGTYMPNNFKGLNRRHSEHGENFAKIPRLISEDFTNALKGIIPFLY